MAHPVCHLVMEDGTIQPTLSPMVSRRSDSWDMFGKKLPKSEIVFLAQILVIYTVVIACIVNISLGSDSDLWIVLMSTCLGAILPHPDLKDFKGLELPRGYSVHELHQ